MNEQQRAVVKQALEVLKRCQMNEAYRNFEQESDTITALCKLLEQPGPVQEPVGEVSGHDWSTGLLYRDLEPGTPLYTTPPAQPAVPLTDEQIDLLINGRGDEDDDDYVEPTGDGFGLTDEDLVKLIRRVEAYHGIGVKP
jgi:hypothetical protein